MIIKNNLKALAGCALLMSNLTLGGGLSYLPDSQIDHTKEICPITIMEERLGVHTHTHQIKKIEEQYKDEFAKLGVEFKASFVDVDEDVVEPKMEKDENGNIKQVLPTGYYQIYSHSEEKIVGYKENRNPIQISVDENGNIIKQDFNGPLFIGAEPNVDYFYMEAIVPEENEAGLKPGTYGTMLPINTNPVTKKR